MNAPSRLARSLGLLLVAVNAIGVALAAYLSYAKVMVIVPPCDGAVSGCEHVLFSAQSQIGPIPIAVLGLGLSLVLLGLSVAWLRTGRRLLVTALYALGLLAMLAEVYLVLVQALLIGDWCQWCLRYGATLVTGFVLSIGLWWATGRETPEAAGALEAV